MKFPIISIILLAGIIVNAQTQGIKINEYKINANLDLSTRQLVIDAQLTIQEKDSSGTIPLLLSDYATIKNVSSTNHEIITVQTSRHDSISLMLPEQLRKKKKITILFSYVLPVDSFMVKKGMIVMKRSDRWYPLQIGDLFTSTIRITVPDNQITVSNGRSNKKVLADHRSSYVWNTDHEKDLFLLIFNPDSMEYRSEVMSGTRINFYFIPGQKDEQNIISLVKNSFEFFSGLIGMYPNNTFTVIEIPADWFLGQGLHTLLIYTSELPEYIPDPANWVPHEVGHQWIGNIIPVDEHSKGYWFVEESLTEYLRAMFVEHLYGTDSLNKMIKAFYLANYKANVKKGKDVAVMDVNSVNESLEEAQCIYAKGPVILHRIRICMGYDNWNAMIKEIYKNSQITKLTVEDFIKYISKYDHEGKCLKLLTGLLIAKDTAEIFEF
jgi:hypothetical protein